jgi:porphobilinogen synthase
MSFPNTRLRRLRDNKNIRKLVRESNISAADLIYPMFVIYGDSVRNPVSGSSPLKCGQSFHRLMSSFIRSEGLSLGSFQGGNGT